MAVLKIAGVEMPAPSSLDYGYSDIDSDSTKRNQAGKLQRYRVRAAVKKLTLNWLAATEANASVLLTAVKPTNFLVTYRDPETTSDVTVTMYCGDRSCKAIWTPNGTRYQISFDLVQY